MPAINIKDRMRLITPQVKSFSNNPKEKIQRRDRFSDLLKEPSVILKSGEKALAKTEGESEGSVETNEKSMEKKESKGLDNVIQGQDLAKGTGMCGYSKSVGSGAEEGPALEEPMTEKMEGCEGDRSENHPLDEKMDVNQGASLMADTHWVVQPGKTELEFSGLGCPLLSGSPDGLGWKGPSTQGEEFNPGSAPVGVVGKGIAGEGLNSGKDPLGLITPNGLASMPGKGEEGQKGEKGTIQMVTHSPANPVMVTEELEGLGAGTGQVVKKGIDSILGDKSPHEFPGISLFETQPDQQPGLDQERPKFQDSSQNGGHQNSKEAVLSPLPLASGASGEALSADKGEISKTHSFEGRQRSGDPGVSPDQTFIIKKHGPSSMEVFLESEGLGKLGIELKISHDKIQGQIMVNDSKGKDVMENNLPRLLSEMANDGLQIGQFTVSLKNQGREQNQTPFFQPEPRARPGAGVEPEVIPPLNTQNHLIHIII